MKQLSNTRIAELLGETAALYEMESEPFKPRAYERAALAIEAREEPLYETFAIGGPGALKEIPGIGAGIAAHIAELLARGTFAEYERLKKKTPVAVGELVAVEGIGPKTVKTLWEKLKIKNLDELEAAATGLRREKRREDSQRHRVPPRSRWEDDSRRGTSRRARAGA